MDLPPHIIERIRLFVAATSKDSYYLDNEAARHGGVSLMGTIGTTWLLRPDGTFWDVDDDSGRPCTPLAPEWHIGALMQGAQLHPWLAEAIPARPPGAVDCGSCRGRGEIPVGDDAHGFLCPDCFAKGWNDSPADSEI